MTRTSPKSSYTGKQAFLGPKTKSKRTLRRAKKVPDFKLVSTGPNTFKIVLSPRMKSRLRGETE